MRLTTRRVPLRSLLRAAAACAVVLLCGAYSCLGPEGDIGYAPGYGYVVKVHRYPTYFNLNNDDKEYYLWFETEQEAQDFVNLRRDNPAGFQQRFGELLSQKRGAVDDEDRDDDEFDKVGRVLRALPPPDLTIPLAVPELPQPIPQTPQ